MKIVFISDTHSMHKKIKDMPEGDVLVHCGDFTGRLSSQEQDLINLNEWLGTLPYKYKLLVPGNHDKWCQTKGGVCRSLLSNGTLLIDEEVTIDGVKFYGSPWTPMFCNWFFMKNRGQALAEVWAKVPDDTQVLVTHGPPMGILDEVPTWGCLPNEYAPEHVGCLDLLNRVTELKNLKVHAFGHIHAGYNNLVRDGVRYVNAAICNEDYKIVNRPWVIDVESKKK